MKTNHSTLTPEGEATAPTGFITDRSPQTNLGGGLSNGQVEKQYPGTEHDNLLIADNGIQSHGGQAINPKPDEETTTIGDGNLGAGTKPVYETYPYPPNPNLEGNLGAERGPYTQPKLQVQGPPQDSYGVRNTFSNTGNYGNPADQALTQVTERVAEAVRREVANELMTPKDPMGLGEEST